MKTRVIGLALVLVASAFSHGWRAEGCLYVLGGHTMYVSCDGGRTWQRYMGAVTASEEPATATAEIVAYPNPATSVLRVRCMVPNAGRAWIIVRDMVGRRVCWSEPALVSSGVQELSVWIGELASGTYQCEVWSTSGWLGRTLIVAGCTRGLEP